MGGAALIQADAKGNLRGEYYRKGLRKEVMGEKYTKICVEAFINQRS